MLQILHCSNTQTISCVSVLLSLCRSRMCHRLPRLATRSSLFVSEMLTRDARQFICHKHIRKHNHKSPSVCVCVWVESKRISLAQQSECIMMISIKPSTSPVIQHVPPLPPPLSWITFITTCTLSQGDEIVLTGPAVC